MALLRLAAGTKGCSLQMSKRVPPAINWFTHAWDGQMATQMLKLAPKYSPETKQEKEKRLLVQAEKRAIRKGDVPSKRLPVLRAGVNTVATLVESKKAWQVATAHEVDPSEWAVSLAALCPKTGVPYHVIKRKARLGCLVPRKTGTTVTFPKVNSEEKGALAKLLEAIGTDDNDRYNESRNHWGGNIPGPKSVARIAKVKKAKPKKPGPQTGLSGHHYIFCTEK